MWLRLLGMGVAQVLPTEDTPKVVSSGLAKEVVTRAALRSVKALWQLKLQWIL
jgi:hypothetical protein